MKVDITGLDKVKVFMHLFNNAKPMGMGVLHFQDRPLDLKKAEQYFRGEYGGWLLDPRRPMYFDYVEGRCMKVNLEGNIINAGGYDRDYGEGALLRVLNNAGLDAKEHREEAV